MEIVWLGHSCFRVRIGDTTLITDPFEESVGFSLLNHRATIVTVSHSHPHHASRAFMHGDATVIRGPGEYEIAGVYIQGMGTPHPTPQGEDQINTVYMIEAEGITVCHLGDLSERPSPRLIEKLSRADVLFAPAGGECTLSPSQIAETINQIGPRIVIPMHYKTEGLIVRLEPLEPLLREMGIKEALPQARLNATPSNLPQDTQMIVLQRAT